MKTDWERERRRQSALKHQRRIQAAADARLREVLSAPERLEQERAFARAHVNDTDEELLEILYQEKKRKRKGFKRAQFVGYLYFIKRFGQWENAITPVNQRLAADKAARKAEREAAKEK